MAIGEVSNRTHATLTPALATRPMPHLPQARAILKQWRRRRDDRNELRRLLRIGPHMIADIGLTCEAARRETEKPFWRR